MKPTTLKKVTPMQGLLHPASSWGLRATDLTVSVFSLRRIIKDFYLAEPDEIKRPKIFGMTASPVDARVDVVKAAR